MPTEVFGHESWPPLGVQAPITIFEMLCCISHSDARNFDQFNFAFHSLFTF